MKDENKRNLYLKIKVNPKETEVIKHKFQNSEIETRNGFVCAMSDNSNM